MKSINKRLQHELINFEKDVNHTRLAKLYEVVNQVFPARLAENESEIVIHIPNTDLDISIWSNVDMKIHIEIGNEKCFAEPVAYTATIWEAAQTINDLYKKYSRQLSQSKETR